MIIEQRTGYEFKTKPWTHQIKALQYLISHGAGALFLDMGTGKSKIICDWIHNCDFKRTLIIAPKRVCPIWKWQLETHLLHINQYAILMIDTQSINQRKNHLLIQDKICNRQITVCNYDAVWRFPLADAIKNVKWDAIICDESHRIKSATSNVSKFMALMGPKVYHKALLTGTPLAQTPLDIFGQYKFLNPDVFGKNYYQFRDHYENIDVGRSTAMGFRMRDKLNPWKNLDEIHEKMFSQAYMVKVSQDLPEQHHIPWIFQADKKTEHVYDDLIKKHVAYLEEGVLTIEYIITLTGRLQQALSGCLPVEEQASGIASKARFSNERLNQLFEIIAGLSPDEPLVIFARYKDDIDAISAKCAEEGITYSELHGRKDTFKSWLNGESRILIAQPQSGSEGVDMTRSRYIIYYSKTHSLSQYNQSLKRIHRPGQTRNVTYYHLICELKRHESIDQIIYNALQSGQRVVDCIMQNGGQF